MLIRFPQRHKAVTIRGFMETGEGEEVTIRFTRNDARGAASCEVRGFNDGSASAIGDDVMLMVDESPNAVAHAVKFVESKGYVRCE
jgi:hypothetical protein